MPRKRATRATATTKAKPPLRISANDSIMSKMSVEERQKKLDKYLMDFDCQAKAYRKKLEEMLASSEAFVRQTFGTVLQQFTPAEREMTVAEYVAKVEAESEEKENREDLVTVVTKPTVLATQSLVSKYRSKRVIDTIPEDAASDAVPTVKRPRKCRKKNQSVAFDDATPSFITPATGRTFDPLNPWGNTPLVTPKFDPRLPITPTQKRRALPGETVMSLAGSPIELNGSGSSKMAANQRARGSTLQIVKEGRTLQLVREGEDKPEMCIDEDELNNIDTMLNSDVTNSNIGKMMSMLKLMVEREVAEKNK